MFRIRPSVYVQPSYFLAFVDNVDLKGADRALVRQNDHEIFAKQFPVGWNVLSHQNINDMLEYTRKTFRKTPMSLVFIQKALMKHYNALVKQEHIPYSDALAIQRRVQQINYAVIDELNGVLHSGEHGQKYYAGYHRQPWVAGRYQRQPVNPNIRDKTIEQHGDIFATVSRIERTGAMRPSFLTSRSSIIGKKSLQMVL